MSVLLYKEITYSVVKKDYSIEDMKDIEVTNYYTISKLTDLMQYIIKTQKVFENFDITKQDLTNMYYHIIKTFEYNGTPIDEIEITNEVYKEIIETMLDYLV